MRINEKVKYCQSCAERYGRTDVLASREWRPGYFICEDCFVPLADNVFSDAGYMTTQLGERIFPIKDPLPIDENSPILNQFYDLLQVPAYLRYTRQEGVMKNRDEIYQYTAPMVENLSLVELTTTIEQYKCIFSFCKLIAEPIAKKIMMLKSEERDKYHVSGTEKSLQEVTKIKKSPATMSQKEKLAKRFNVTVEELEKMQAVAKGVQKIENENKFNTMIGKPTDGLCRKAFILDGKPAICKLSEGHSEPHSNIAQLELKP
jgi:hypothetical protein